MNAPYELPEKFLVCADLTTDSYCLVETEYVHREGSGELKFWKMRLLSQPAYCVKRGAWREDGIELPSYTYHHERDSRRAGRDKQVLENQIWRTKQYIRLPGMSPLYVYGMSYANKVLPSEFYKVGKGEDPYERWHFKKREVFRIGPENQDEREFEQRFHRTEAAAQASLTNSPPALGILQRYFHLVLEKGEDCPILMERLTAETIACGPCGHCCSYMALARAVQSTGGCPVCRTQFRVGQIVRLS
jgi:hypothetical protein